MTEIDRLEAEIRALKGELEIMTNRAELAENEWCKRVERIADLDAVASQRWHDLKACEKLNRQVEKALKAALYIAKTDTGPVHSQLRRDIREAEKVLEIVASRKRAKRA